ncbi:MAG: fibronectin type III domain-containing protein [Patescibacteria group bacterium]
MGSVDHLAPVLSDYTRDGVSGQITISQIAAGDYGVVFALSQFNSFFALIGGRIGPGVVTLNLSAFEGVPVAVVGFWQDPSINWMVSLASNRIYETLPEAPSPTAFGGVANDETGTSVTLTLTPPATGDYEKTNIYKRLLTASTWTLAGTYTGEQGVAGTKQITGLTADRAYEFIVMAEANDLESSPSVARRCFVFAGDNYVAALASTAAVLLADSTLAGYVDAINVQEWDETRIPSFEAACLIVAPISRTPTTIALKRKIDIYEIGIHCLTPGPAEEWSGEDGLDAAEGIVQLTGDVFRALNGGDLLGTVEPYTGEELTTRIPYDKILSGHYYHSVVTLRVASLPYTEA